MIVRLMSLALVVVSLWQPHNTLRIVLARIDGGNNLQYPGTACGSSIPSSDPRLLPAGTLKR